MHKHIVSIERYERPFESVRKAVLSCGGLDRIPPKARVFIKPNIVFWTRACAFPKWGMITTSRVIEDTVLLLKEHGIEDITIGEGIVCGAADKQETPAHAFKTLGYETLRQRYGVKYINVMERPFQKVDLGDGLVLRFNRDILSSEFIVNIPVLKSHNQTIVSLSLKNLKGVIDGDSRKRCHNADLRKDLHFHISRLAEKMPPMLSLIDGIYSLERGPSFDGKVKRSNLLIASADFLSADLVGARVLGYDPADVPHLALAAQKRSLSTELSSVDVVGEKVEAVASVHAYDYVYSKNESGEMPLPLANQGITGLYYRKFDQTMCTYCAKLNGLILTAIRHAWKGRPFDNVEVLTGKIMRPAPGMATTVLIGRCMHKLNKDHPHIRKAVALKGCPPNPADAVAALREAGIEADPFLFEQIESLPGFFMERYHGKAEFDESFFRVE